jgi:hypothetical protein
MVGWPPQTIGSRLVFALTYIWNGFWLVAFAAWATIQGLSSALQTLTTLGLEEKLLVSCALAIPVLALLYLYGLLIWIYRGNWPAEVRFSWKHYLGFAVSAASLWLFLWVWRELHDLTFPYFWSYVGYVIIGIVESEPWTHYAFNFLIFVTEFIVLSAVYGIFWFMVVAALSTRYEI